MEKPQKKMRKERNAILLDNEWKANLFTAKVMRITLVVFTIIYILNCIGIFVVPKDTMTISYITGAICMLLPTFIVNVLKKQEDWVKYFNIACAVFTVMAIYINLTFHAVAFLVFGIAIASLYFSTKLTIYATVLTIIGASVSQIISYAYKILPDHNFDDWYHVIGFSILPRAMILIALALLFGVVSHRTSELLGNLMGADEQKRMLDKLSNMKKKSIEVSDNLVGMVTELSEISEVSNEANQRIASETEQILQGSSDNTNYVTQVNQHMKDIIMQLQNMKQMSEQIMQLSNQVRELSKENQSRMRHAADSMEQINESSTTCREVITKLGKESEEIIGIVHVITGISNQTNILALNASIEAARAGEHGAGFSVVAEQIQRLAEQTKSAVESIGKIIHGVVERTGEAVVAMDQSSQLTQNGLEQIRGMEESSQIIASANQNMVAEIVKMSEITKHVYSNGQQVSENMDQVQQNTTNNCSAVEQVTAATQENSASIENIADMVDRIQDIAKELNEVVK